PMYRPSSILPALRCLALLMQSIYRPPVLKSTFSSHALARRLGSSRGDEALNFFAPGPVERPRVPIYMEPPYVGCYRLAGFDAKGGLMIAAFRAASYRVRAGTVAPAQTTCQQHWVRHAGLPSSESARGRAHSDTSLTRRH